MAYLVCHYASTESRVFLTRPRNPPAQPKTSGFLGGENDVGHTPTINISQLIVGIFMNAMKVIHLLSVLITGVSE